MSTVDELYAVSDLHLGGLEGAQIFNQGKRLAAFIDYVRSRPKKKRTALVLNGDIVDFLAEDEASKSYLKPDKAVAILERVMADPAFAPVWQALGRYVKTADRLLVMCLGNHDVELALPRSQERIYKELCGDDAAARAQIIWAMDGKGFLCGVGPARVFCTHGNEVDPWNIIDYEQLSAVAAAQAVGQEPPAWNPNAGTQLVIDVMNSVKSRFPFVDLLKPETKIVPPMILSLEPESIGLLRNFGSILYRRVRGSVRSGFLGGPGAPDEGEEAFVRGMVLGKRLQGRLGPTLAQDQVLEQMEADFKAGLRPQQVLNIEGQEGMLGLGQLVWDRLRGRPQMPALRDAIRDWLKDDNTFEFTTTDETSERLDQTLDPNFDFVLAGHTHLARAIRRKSGRGTYFNSGTWIRLIRLTQQMLASDDAFAPIYQALTDGTMRAIDNAQSLVYLRPTVVRVISDGRATTGELTRVELDDQGQAVLTPEPQTRFTRS